MDFLGDYDDLRRKYRANTFSDIDLAGLESGLEGIPQVSALVLFHICQEALPTPPSMRLQSAFTCICGPPGQDPVEVQDDGKGFAVEKMSANIGHGLSNMHTRARAVGVTSKSARVPARERRFLPGFLGTQEPNGCQKPLFLTFGRRIARALRWVGAMIPGIIS